MCFSTGPASPWLQRHGWRCWPLRRNSVISPDDTVRAAPASRVATIGLVTRPVVDPIASDPFHGRVLHGAEQACRERRISLLDATVGENVATIEMLPVMIQRRQVQGPPVVGYADPEFYGLLQRIGLPFVLVDPPRRDGYGRIA